MTRVLIVVLNWNSPEDTISCIGSLLKQSYKSFDILVVDNGSTNNFVQHIEVFNKKYSNVHFVKNNKNLGFAGGVNVGIKYAIKQGYNAVVLFNNDAIAERDWLKYLVDSLKDDVYISTGLLLDIDGKFIDSTGDIYSTWGVSFPRGRNLPKSKAPESGFVFGATGGAVIYKTSLFEEIGLFDEIFFAYYEDVDVSFRAQLAGHKVYYTKDAVAYHKRGATSNKIPGLTTYQTFKNLPLLFWKNVPTKLLIRVGLRFFLLYNLIFINAIKNKSGWPAFRGVLAGIYYFWTDALWKRMIIQQNKKVSADYIWSILYHDLPPEQTGMRKFRKLFTGKG